MALILQCLEMIRVDHERGFKFLKRFFRFLQAKQCKSEIVQCIDAPRLKRKRHLVACARPLKPRESEQSVAFVIKRVGVVGPKLNCTLTALQSLLRNVQVR